MKIRKAVVTAAGAGQGGLLLQHLVDRKPFVVRRGLSPLLVLLGDSPWV